MKTLKSIKIQDSSIIDECYRKRVIAQIIKAIIELKSIGRNKMVIEMPETMEHNGYKLDLQLNEDDSIKCMWIEIYKNDKGFTVEDKNEAFMVKNVEELVQELFTEGKGIAWYDFRVIRMY